MLDSVKSTITLQKRTIEVCITSPRTRRKRIPPQFLDRLRTSHLSISRRKWQLRLLLIILSLNNSFRQRHDKNKWNNRIRILLHLDVESKQAPKMGNRLDKENKHNEIRLPPKIPRNELLLKISKSHAQKKNIITAHISLPHGLIQTLTHQ